MTEMGFGRGAIGSGGRVKGFSAGLIGIYGCAISCVMLVVAGIAGSGLGGNGRKIIFGI